MCSAPNKNPFNTPVASLGQIWECGFIWTFVIAA